MATREHETQEFGGVCGRVLRAAMSGATLVTGLTLVISLGALGFIMDSFGGNNAFTVFVLFAVALVLARFALNGFAGEMGGTVFSGRGGSWYDSAVVGLRCLALSSLWLFPMLLLGWKPELVGEAVGTMMFGAGGTRVMSLTTLVIAFLTLTPPVFLIVSVSASRFPDLIDKDHWTGVFSGRASDLYLIYVIYLGALTMLAVMFLPVFTAVAFQNSDMANIMGLFWLAFASGLSVNLLGRLCGFFAATQFGREEWADDPTPASPPEDDLPGVSPGPEPGLAHEEARPTPIPALKPALVAPKPAGEASTLNPSGKTPLLDARERVDELQPRFEEDPELVISHLEELDKNYAPHPLVLHLLCLSLSQRGCGEESLEIAGRAIPLCLDRGAFPLATEIFVLHLEKAETFDLPRDIVLALGNELRKNKDLAAAEEIYTRALNRDPGEQRAVKGLMQIAEHHIEETNYVHARGLYRMLLETCSDSPFAVHMQQGLEDTERRMAKAS